MTAALLLLALAPVVQQAQTQPQPSTTTQQDDEVYDLGEVLVTAPTPRGVALGGQEPIASFDSTQLQAFGASSIGELVTLLESQTRSARGGSPVFLVNGRRISGFQEIRGLPPEAIDRFDILPEETALSYGYRADQRVVNIVLKANFRSLTTQVEYGAPTQGGRTSTEFENNVLRIEGGTRWSFDLNHERDSAIFESERDINRTLGGAPFDLIGNVTGLPQGAEIDPALSALAGGVVTVAAVPANAASGGVTLQDFTQGAGIVRNGDVSAWRTLTPQREQIELSGTLKRDLNEQVGATVSVNLEDLDSESYLGLPGVSLTLDADNPFSPFGTDVLVHRYVDQPEALRRESETRTANVATVLDGYVGDWRWTATGGYDRVETESRTGRGVDAAALQALLDANSSTANPFGDIGGAVTAIPFDTARSVAGTLNTELVLTGSPFTLPAGDVRTTITGGYRRLTLDSESTRSGVFSERSLSRNLGNVQANVDVPLFQRDEENPSLLGDLRANFNVAYQEVSDFGGLPTVGGGVNWSPIDPLNFNVSYTDEKNAPSVQQLNDPTELTPNTPVFDFRNGETVDVIRITGGDPNLEAEHKRTLKLGLNYTPWTSVDFRLNAAYTRTEIDDSIATFPTITADLEAALPERFVRDAGGNLLSIDARALNYEKIERQEVQWGFNFSRPFGQPTPQAAPGQGNPGGPGARGPGGRPGGGTTITFGGPGGGPGGPGGRRGGSGAQPGQGVFNLSVTHIMRIQDEVTIRDGLEPLDLLDGDSIVSSGGQPRNELQLQAGAFRNGFGAFLNANWRESTRVFGDLAGSPDLEFSDRTTVNLFTFADLGSRTSLVERFPILKGSRVGFGVTNLFDSRTEVTSSDGTTPLNYQEDYLEPVGRAFRINFRKIFY